MPTQCALPKKSTERMQKSARLPFLFLLCAVGLALCQQAAAEQEHPPPLQQQGEGVQQQQEADAAAGAVAADGCCLPHDFKAHYDYFGDLYPVTAYRADIYYFVVGILVRLSAVGSAIKFAFLRVFF